MYFYGDVEPSKRLGFRDASRWPRLGLREGEARVQCGPGEVKAYLPDWPYQKCVPAEEMLEPRPGEVPIAPPPPAPTPGPAPLPAAPPALPALPAPPGKARFLRVDPDGTIVDPDTGQPIAEQSFFMTETARPIIGAVVGLGIVALALWAIGVFK